MILASIDIAVWFTLVGMTTTLALTRLPADRPDGLAKVATPHTTHAGVGLAEAIPRSTRQGMCDQACHAVRRRRAVRRRITSATSLRLMHVTEYMAQSLGLSLDRLSFAGLECHQSCITERPKHAIAEDQPAQAVCCTSTRVRPIFRCKIMLRDKTGSMWPVAYEATASLKQYHRRLTQGWREFCGHHDLRVGDAVDFSPCPPGDVTTLAVAIVR
jgi:hypothetical protein